MKPLPLSRLSTRPTQIIAHRGASGHAPENTLAAFHLAAKLGADGLECDIQRTADGELVIFHDDELERTSSLSGLLRQKSWAELRQADAGAWFSPAFAGERIPTLAETLAFLRESRLIGHLELKDPHLFPDIEAQVADLIRAYAMTDFVQVRSFYHEALHRFHAYAPEIAVSELWFDRVPTAEESYFPTVDLAYPFLLNGDGLARLHALGKKVSAWTVNDPADGQQLIAAGLDALATDFPDRFLP